MSRVVYSTQFIGVQGLGSGGARYVIPVGCIIVVRDVRWYIDAVLSTSQCFVVDETSGATIFYHEAKIGERGEFGREQRTVLPEGHVLKAYTGGPVGDVTVSGYLLTV